MRERQKRIKENNDHFFFAIDKPSMLFGYAGPSNRF